MSLAKFVLENRRKILDGWDQFAVTMPGAEELDQAALRASAIDAAQSINRLVNDLLDVARTRLGGVSYHSSSNSLTASRCASA